MKNVLSRVLCHVSRDSYQKGITLLLVIVILSAILSISIGIFNVIFGQILLSGEIGDSFRAFYAADQGVERMLWRDRNGGPIADQEEQSRRDGLTGGALDLDACFSASITKADIPGISEDQVTIRSTGEYRCQGAGRRVVRRGLEILYRF